MTRYTPLKGNAYLQLPSKLQKSKYILNITNENSKCALWCILAHLHPKYHRRGEKEHGYRINDVEAYRKHEDEVNTDGIIFPLKIVDVSIVETLNDLNINIFGIDEFCKIIPIRISEQHNVPPA